MLAAWWQIMPYFMVKWVAQHYSEVFLIDGTRFHWPFPDTLIRAKK